MNERTTRTFRVWLEGPFVRLRFHDGAEVTLDDAKLNVRTTAELLGGRGALPMLVDVRFARAMSADARAYFAGPECGRVGNPVALLIDSPLSRALGNIFLGFSRPIVVTRLFTDEAEAKRWLHGFVSRRAIEAA